MTRKLLFLWMFCIVLSAGGLAQSAERQPVEVRHPPQEKVTDYASQQAFRYRGVPQKPESFLNRFKRWLGQKLEGFFDNPIVETTVGILIYIVFGLLIVLIITQLMKGGISGLFAGKKGENPNAFSIQQKSGSQGDFDSLIDRAIRNQQYRLATRYLYQDSLQQLRNNGYINWKKEKTNSDYVYEIKSDDLRELFRELTQYYEYAEYGNFALSSDKFSKVHHRFKEMRTLIQSTG